MDYVALLVAGVAVLVSLRALAIARRIEHKVIIRKTKARPGLITGVPSRFHEEEQPWLDD